MKNRNILSDKNYWLATIEPLKNYNNIWEYLFFIFPLDFTFFNYSVLTSQQSNFWEPLFCSRWRVSCLFSSSSSWLSRGAQEPLLKLANLMALAPRSLLLSLAVTSEGNVEGREFGVRDITFDFLFFVLSCQHESHSYIILGTSINNF